MPYSITTKDGITIQNIPDNIQPDDPSIKQRVAKIRESGVADAVDKPNKPPMAGKERLPYDENATFGDRLANFGKAAKVAITAPLVGGSQRLGINNAQGIADAWREDMADMSNKPGGMGGLIAGGAATSAPLAMVPGANTVIGGTALGAMTGALMPTEQGESPVANMIGGTVAGGAVPVAIRVGKAAKAALVDPFTEAGRNRIAGGVLNRSAADPAAVAARLRSASAATPGFEPTVGQAANDAGVAALERTMRAVDPRGFDAVDKSQRGALVDALRKVAGTPEARQAAIQSREQAVESLYDQAKKATVTGDSTLDALLSRPSMQSAQARAANLAKERGESFALSQARPSQTVTGPINPATGQAQTTVIPGQPAIFSGKSLHDLKMGLSDAIGSPVSGLQGAERGAAIDTQNAFLQWLENKVPAYGQARTTFAEKSQPINQIDIGQELYRRFVPALAEADVPFKTRADSLAQALRNGDDLARNVTGLKSATMEGIMSPEQMAALRGVVSDSQMVKAAESAGRGVGSDTVQKLSMSHLASEAGIPNWAASMMRVPGGWMKRAGDVLYGSSDEAVRARLADILRNPVEAAQAMQAAGASPSKITELLKKAAQAAALAAPSSQQALTAE